MSAPHENPFKVFYSWQSDLPDAVNLKLIRNALNQAANSINVSHELDLHVLIDEATREVPGSPNIADSIFKKIRDSDVFVCDLTKVAEVTNEAGSVRKYCNPNVAIELGYAIRVLGWDRIIIIFNEAFGEVPDDLPFDARGHRASIYRCSAGLNSIDQSTENLISHINNSTGALRKLLVNALKLISRENPKLPSQRESKSPGVLRRERDLEQLNNAFHWINLNMLDRFIAKVRSGRLLTVGLDFCDFLGIAIDGSEFHLNDSRLRDLLVDFHKAWERCGMYSHSMEGNQDISELRFVMPGDIPRTLEQGQQLRDTINSGLPLRSALDALLDYVREEYVEIDVSKTGAEALREYLS